MITRRKMLVGLSALIAAPAVISYSNLMPIKLVRTKPYAIVHGTGLDGNEKIMELWEPMSAADWGGQAHNHFLSVMSWQGESLSNQSVANHMKERDDKVRAMYEQWRNTDGWGNEIKWPEPKGKMPKLQGLNELEKSPDKWGYMGIKSEYETPRASIYTHQELIEQGKRLSSDANYFDRV